WVRKVRGIPRWLRDQADRRPELAIAAGLERRRVHALLGFRQDRHGFRRRRGGYIRLYTAVPDRVAIRREPHLGAEEQRRAVTQREGGTVMFSRTIVRSASD